MPRRPLGMTHSLLVNRAIVKSWILVDLAIENGHLYWIYPLNMAIEIVDLPIEDGHFPVRWPSGSVKIAIFSGAKRTIFVPGRL